MGTTTTTVHRPGSTTRGRGRPASRRSPPGQVEGEEKARRPRRTSRRRHAGHGGRRTRRRRLRPRSAHQHRGTPADAEDRPGHRQKTRAPTTRHRPPRLSSTPGTVQWRASRHRAAGWSGGTWTGTGGTTAPAAARPPSPAPVALGAATPPARRDATSSSARCRVVNSSAAADPRGEDRRRGHTARGAGCAGSGASSPAPIGVGVATHAADARATSGLSA